MCLILTCAGKGCRAGFDKNKLLVPFGGKNCLTRSLEAFYKSGLIDEYIVTASKEDYEEVRSTLPQEVAVVYGGATRTESVKNALSTVKSDIVLIHDGARPFVSARIIKDCIDAAAKYGSGITAIPSRDTVLSAKDGIIQDYLGKDGLYSVQTPQAFLTDKIKAAYNLAEGKTFNDDGEVFMAAFGNTHLVQGDADNIKLTYPEDFKIFTKTDAAAVGTGFDCHRLVEGRKLILGGVEIAHDKGLLGHSDADVLTHAVMDAILAALSLRDIGYHFPDTDDRYKGADSMKLLSAVLEMIKEKGYAVSGVSAVIMAQKPKLLGHIPAITQSLASALSLPAEKVGIGATTLEGLGFVGREEGICVHATATLKKI